MIEKFFSQTKIGTNQIDSFCNEEENTNGLKYALVMLVKLS